MATLSPEWRKFLDAISETYVHFDEDRTLLTRSIEISSKELTTINQRLKAENKATTERAEEAAKLNELMVNRELKMIELKKEIAQLQEALSKQIPPMQP